MPTLIKPLETIYQPIQSDLKRVEDALKTELVEVEGFVGQMTGYVSQMLGKRLRPALSLLSAQAVSSENHAPVNEKVILAAAAVELVHTATLVHDDVIDEARLRRGQTTVNARWGNTLSVLAGDYLYAQAFCVLSRIGNLKVLDLMSRTSQRVCVGEVSQVKHLFDLDLAEEAYLEFIQEKTASLMEAAAESGALLSGAEADVVQKFAAFGQAFGTAFQIVDDCHDLLGSEDQFGKSLGADFSHGKMTLPLILLRDSLEGEALKQVRALLAKASPQNGDSLLFLRDLAREHHIEQACLNRAEIFVDEAKGALESIPGSEARDGLIHLVDYVLSA